MFSITVTSGCFATSQSNDPTNRLTLTEENTSLGSDKALNEKQRLKNLIESYTLDQYQFNPFSATFKGISDYNDKFLPVISVNNLESRIALERDLLEKLNTIDSSQLSGQDFLTYQMFKRERLQTIESSKFPSQQLPINQMFGMHNFYAVLGSGESAQPFNTEKDYRNFMKRSEGFARWMDSVITAMRKGISQGNVLPRAIVEKLIPQLQNHIVTDITSSVFYSPLNSLPEDLSVDNKRRLIKDYQHNIKTVVIPAYQRVHDFLSTEYLQKSRETFGLSDLPNGKHWYEFMIKVHTTLPLTAEEIHQFGRDEVSRILNEMRTVKKEVKFEGSLAEFFEFLRNDPQFYFEKPDDLVNAYQNIKLKIDATLPKLFNVFPKADYIVKKVPDFQAQSSAGAYYSSPSPDGERPGVFYINTYNMKSQPKILMETLSIHEAAPGHHFQIALQQEIENLPDFRKYGGITVFNEGWALYAESLGKELGLFTDPYMWYGRLVDEQLRAMRLVVDTGLHAYGWSREQAIQYMMDNSSMALSDVEAEVERYIVTPGQALAYKVGQRKIQQLRELGEKKLGNKFDIKEFHAQILMDGSLPMPLLEKKINDWISKKS